MDTGSNNVTECGVSPLRRQREACDEVVEHSGQGCQHPIGKLQPSSGAFWQGQPNAFDEGNQGVDHPARGRGQEGLG
jgi:hypothetical protein